tara:strand:- start:437 stop:1312 length:876 start_codon:yes stop_codon:yes gene_type:complete
MVKLESYTDYPKQASENAKIALRYAEENGWGSCGTAVGKQRANQLAKGEPISRDTIARMAAFERHRQNSKKKLGDGCGRLMWLAWGGDAGVKWAQRKLKQIDKEKSLKMTAYERVLNRLTKNKEVELKSEKVELSIIDDLNNALSASSKTIAEMNEILKKINSLNSDIDKGKKKFEKASADEKKASDKFFKLEDEFLKAKRIYNDSIDKRKQELEYIDRDRDLLNKERKNSIKILKQREKLEAIFNKNIRRAEKAAKELGLKLPIDKYKKALDRLIDLHQRISIASDKNKI